VGPGDAVVGALADGVLVVCCGWRVRALAGFTPLAERFLAVGALRDLVAVVARGFEAALGAGVAFGAALRVAVDADTALEPAPAAFA
jgi:hypothetical protein